MRTHVENSANGVAAPDYWDKHWLDTPFAIAPPHHRVRAWIESHFTKTSGSCFEVGCFPGSFLAVFGELGYRLSGVDFFPGTQVLETWLKGRGYTVDRLDQADFLTYTPEQQYDVVSSFGFIEHFEQWPDLIKKQLGLVKRGGVIVVEVPNLTSPLYSWIYRILEPSLLKSHVQEAMNLSAIRSVLEQEGCRIVAAEYIGSYYFRFVTKKGRMYRWLERCIQAFSPVFRVFPHSLSARYIGLIAEKGKAA